MYTGIVYNGHRVSGLFWVVLSYIALIVHLGPGLYITVGLFSGGGIRGTVEPPLTTMHLQRATTRYKTAKNSGPDWNYNDSMSVKKPLRNSHLGLTQYNEQLCSFPVLLQNNLPERTATPRIRNCWDIVIANHLWKLSCSLSLQHFQSLYDN